MRRIPTIVIAWLDNTQGLIEPDEGRRLAELAARVPSEQAIVEVGSHTGLSSCWLAAGSRSGHGAHVTCVDPYPAPRAGSLDDPWELGPEGVLERFKSNAAGQTQEVKVPSFWPQLSLLRTTSAEAARIWIKSVGLLFVDAVHEYDAVWADWGAWRHLVDGVVAFHDYGDSYPGTRRAVDEIVEQHGPFTDVRVTGSLWEGRRPQV